jgi:hypothetical protein
MNPSPTDGLSQIPPHVVEQINRACDRLEAAGNEGGPLTIEDLLVGADDAVRPALLRELIAVELAWRRSNGERPSPDEYHRKFPADAPWVDAAFCEEGDETSRSPRKPPKAQPGVANIGENLLFGILALQNK